MNLIEILFSTQLKFIQYRSKNILRGRMENDLLKCVMYSKIMYQMVM